MRKAVFRVITVLILLGSFATGYIVVPKHREKEIDFIIEQCLLWKYDNTLNEMLISEGLDKNPDIVKNMQNRDITGYYVSGISSLYRTKCTVYVYPELTDEIEKLLRRDFYNAYWLEYKGTSTPPVF